ncbi:MAG: hypothetical protein ACTS8H_02750 [Arsenophonus sp. NC-PE1-MAG3]
MSDKLDAEESIKGGCSLFIISDFALTITISPYDHIWFSLTPYNIGLRHLLNVRKLTRIQSGDPNSWLAVKVRLLLLSKKKYFSKLTYGYAQTYEALAMLKTFVLLLNLDLVIYQIKNKSKYSTSCKISFLFSRISSKKNSD